MKTSVPIVAFLGAFLLFGAAASAVDIENADEDAYQVTVGEGEGAETFSLLPGGKQRNVCEERCTIQVEGVGSIEADEDELVVIRDGAITKRSKAL